MLNVEISHSVKKQFTYPNLGFGLGLRSPHIPYVLQHQPAVDWFEIISENYFSEGGLNIYQLEKVREQYPIVMHGVSLSIGGSDPLDSEYLTRLKRLAEKIQPAWISDHLCWTSVEGKQLHDLLPLPYTEEVIVHVVARVKQVQEFLGRRILLENVSSYLSYRHSEMNEWEFLIEIAERSDCLLLLDINNVFVSSYNHQSDPLTYIDTLPVERVQQFHLAGHDNHGDYILDTHARPIIQEVWELYRYALKRFPNVSTMIERDDNIPEFGELYEELQQAKSIAQEVRLYID